jgi:S-formylglutathione hydrolase
MFLNESEYGRAAVSSLRDLPSCVQEIQASYNARMPCRWDRVLIAGKPADVLVPADGTQIRFGLLFLHDLDGRTLRDDPKFTPLLDAAGLACVCPFGNQSWWTDRTCPDFDPSLTAERYVVDCVTPYFVAQWGLESKAIGLLGVGMGGQGALRLAFRHPKTFLTVAALAPSIEYQELYGRGTPLDEMYASKEQCRQDTAILHLHPSHYPPHIYFAADPDDPWYRGCDRLHEKMNALGVPHTAQFIAGGSGWNFATKMAERAMRFILEGLEMESRRLL